MDKTLKGAGDFELWARFFNNNFKLYRSTSQSAFL